MKFRKIFYLFVSTVLITIGFFSCNETEEKRMVVDYSFSCSPDLLKFVEPVTSYEDQNGKEISIVPKVEEFKEVDRGNIHMEIIVNGNSIMVDKIFHDNSWSFTKQYKGWEVIDRIKISFRLRDNWEIDSEEEYTFYYSIFNYTIYVYSGDKLLNIYEKNNQVSENILKGKEEVISWLDTLCSVSYTNNMDIKAVLDSKKENINSDKK